MEGGYELCTDKIRPDPHPRSQIRISRQQFSSMVRIGILKKFADDCRFIEGLIVVLKYWHKAPRADTSLRRGETLRSGE